MFFIPAYFSCRFGRSHNIVVLKDHAIMPHLFQPVKLPCLFLEDMDNHIDIVNENPLERLVAFFPVWCLITFFSNLFFNFVSDRFYLDC